MKYSFLFIITVWCINPVFSQEDKLETEEVDVFKMTLAEILDTKVQIGSKTDESLHHSPSSVTVFTKEEIEQLGLDNLYDLLNFVPGFQTERSISIGEIPLVHLRGNNASDPYLLIQIDGVTVNEISLGSTSTYTRYLSLHAIKQVEIIRGPGAALYGSNAFLGVVNLITDKSKKNIELGKGSQGRSHLSTFYGDELSNDLSIHLGGEFYSDNGTEYVIDDSTNTRDPRAYQKMDVGLNYKNVHLRLMYSKEETNQFYNFGKIDNEINKNQTQNMFAQLSYKWQANKKLHLEPFLTFSRWTWDDIGLLVPAGAAASSHNFYGGPLSQSSKYSFKVDGQYELSSLDLLIFGVEAHNYGLDYSGAYSNHIAPDGSVIAPVEEYYIGEIKPHKEIGSFQDLAQYLQNYGVYAQYRREIGSSFLTYLGGRVDYYSIAKGAFSPRLALIYLTPINSSLKLMYGEAFRAPVHNELFGEDPTNTRSGELYPEKIKTIELAYVQSFGWGEMDLTYFFNNITNPIEEVPSEPGSQVVKMVNIDTVYQTNGLEFSSKIKVLPTAYLRFTATSIIKPASDYAFENYASLIANYQTGKLNFSLSGVYRSRREVMTGVQGNYGILNGRISYSLPKGFYLYVKGMNLLDTEYFTYTPSLENNAVVNRGIEFEVGLGVNLE